MTKSHAIVPGKGIKNLLGKNWEFKTKCRKHTTFAVILEGRFDRDDGKD